MKFSLQLGLELVSVTAVKIMGIGSMFNLCLGRNSGLKFFSCLFCKKVGGQLLIFGIS